VKEQPDAEWVEDVRRMLRYLCIVLDEDETGPSPNKPAVKDVIRMLGWLDVVAAQEKETADDSGPTSGTATDPVTGRAEAAATRPTDAGAGEAGEVGTGGV
jgi:hypothetical protein